MPVPIHIAVGSNLATGLIGLFVGNWLAIGRDKRKEFNAIAKRITRVLLNAREQLYPDAEWPDKIDIPFFREGLPLWRRRRFDAALCTYKQASSDDNTTEDEYGDISYKDPKLVAHHIDKVLKLTRNNLTNASSTTSPSRRFASC